MSMHATRCGTVLGELNLEDIAAQDTCRRLRIRSVPTIPAIHYVPGTLRYSLI